MKILTIIVHAGIVLLVVNIAIYSVGFIKNDRAYKYFTVYLVAMGIIQTATEILALNSYNNHFLSGYYLFAQFILISCFFYYVFLPIDRGKSRLIKYVSGFTVLLLSGQYAAYPDLYYNFNPLGFLVTALILIVYCVMYIFENLTKKLLYNYITIGIFLYLICSAIIFASSISILTLKEDVFISLWTINAVLFIFYQLLILWEWKQHFYRRTIK